MSRTLTTEALLTSPLAFGLTTATPAQRALCRALDGLPLGELASCEDVVQSFGGPAAIAALPVGDPPLEAHVLGPIRGAKTMSVAAHVVVLSHSVDVSGCAPGDIVRIGISALKLEGTRPLMSHLLAALAKPLLRPLVIGEPSEQIIVLRHPTGRPIEIVPTPIDRAGGSALSVWSAGHVVDEEPRQIGAEDGVKNWDELHRAVIGRILPGGKFLGVGTPHAPYGPIYDLVKERFGKPSRDMVIFKATGPAMNPFWWSPERCEALRRRDPEAYRSDVLTEFRAVESSAFPIDAVDDAIGAPIPHYLEVGAPIVAIDLSAMKHDACAIAVLRWILLHPGAPHLWADGRAPDGSIIKDAYPLRDPITGALVPNPHYGQSRRVLVCEHIEGIEPNDPNRAGPVTGEMVANCVVSVAHAFGARFIAADQWEELSFPALLRDRDSSLRYQVFRWSGGATGSKSPAVERLRSLLVSRQIILPKHAKLREELIRFRRVVTQSGERFEAAPGATHGDYASTLITAVMADTENCIPLSPIGRRGGVVSYDPYSDQASYD